MSLTNMPDHIARISPGEPFTFSCHRNVDCFTNCCRQLELALTPYDVLRLRHATQLHSSELLERYIIIEKETTDIFPRFYLTMVDDGNASCVFVTQKGCSIYKNRPGACRTYPMGRAIIRSGDTVDEFFVLLQEPHCHGFQEKTIQTIKSFSSSQDLEQYNKFNDMVVDIQQHESIRNGMKLNEHQISCYTMALYDVDTFRQKLRRGNINRDPAMPTDIYTDDESLLRYGLAWVGNELFG